jgi:hypothetical protein
MISSEFKKEEYWLIKWPLVSLVFSLILCGGLLVGLNTVNATAATELRRARSDLDEAREALDKIEEEEATIIEYIGRFQEIEQDGVVTAEDRLQFQERLLEISDQFNLFPVGLIIQGQTALPLEYAAGRERGREIILNTSLVELNLPMLHENDLANLLLSLMDGPGLLQPLTCSITPNNTNTTSFIYLARHFNAACTLNWYTFKLPPPEETE